MYLNCFLFGNREKIYQKQNWHCLRFWNVTSSLNFVKCCALLINARLPVCFYQYITLKWKTLHADLMFPYLSYFPQYRILLGGCWYTICGLPKLVPDANLKSPLLGSPIKLNQQQRNSNKLEEGALDPNQASLSERDGLNPSARPISPSDSEMRINIELYPGAPSSGSGRQMKTGQSK